ncbi:hypothetical protein PC128_g19752 [Phytophthora cactorum]|nr:hypothetical protein PC128_g19752 [Phytophthora cactorum]
MSRYCLTRVEHFYLEEAFDLVFREDYVVAASYARAIFSDTRESTPEFMEIDAIDASCDRRGSRPLICFRCR